ncbi:MAG: glycosyltransferase family 2 protein, partial [Chloroflexota bacterium]|nr:glycosyltransferase family 2 protein [Chloroflexota bacterium]
FDVEILFIARKRSYKIVEVPINWYYSSESKVKAVPDALRMGSDLLVVRRNYRMGVYNDCIE